MADLITPVRDHLAKMSDAELVALGATPPDGDTHFHFWLNGSRFACPPEWVSSERVRRGMAALPSDCSCPHHYRVVH